MNKQMKECMKPHAMLHSLFGLGLGFLLASLLSLTGSTGIILGLIVMAVALVGDLTMAKKNK